VTLLTWGRLSGVPPRLGQRCNARLCRGTMDHWNALPRLYNVELGILAVTCEHYRRIHERGFGLQLWRDRLAHHLGVDSIHIR
jgi:hypothetical protein